jgi:hypothetical protein
VTGVMPRSLAILTSRAFCLFRLLGSGMSGANVTKVGRNWPV